MIALLDIIVSLVVFAIMAFMTFNVFKAAEDNNWHSVCGWLLALLLWTYIGYLIVTSTP